MRDIRIAVVGDYNDHFVPHTTIATAIEHSSAWLAGDFAVDWVPSDKVDDNALADADAIWIAPGSPFRSMAGALAAVTQGRTTHIPTLGTCGGYQYMAIEYARHVLGIADAAHAEHDHDPYASTLFISELTCSLDGQRLTVQLSPRSRTAGHYGVESADERYYCNFGLNPQYQKELHDGGFRVAGTDHHGEARILELPDHPFFIATLFVPQTTSTAQRPHPLVTGFLRAAQHNQR